MYATVRKFAPVAVALAFALQSACGGNAKPPKKPTPVAKKPPKPAPPPKGPFLYEVTKDGNSAVLFGTIHIGVSPTNDLPPIVWKTFAASKVLVLEVDPTTVNPIKLLIKALNFAGKPLDEQLGAEHWEKLTKISTKIPAKSLRRVQPWFVQMLLAVTSLDSTVTMEPEFIAYAKENAISLETLETIDDQIIAVQDSFAIEDLKDMIDGWEEHKITTAKLLHAYRTGDLATFLELFSADMEEGSQSEDLLLRKRNENWMPKIETLIAAGGAFIAVGAGHLYGKHGLIKLLEARGYTVRRLATATGGTKSASSRVAELDVVTDRANIAA